MTIALILTPSQKKQLLKLDAQLQWELDHQAFPVPATVSKLKAALQEALHQQADFGVFWESVAHQANTLYLVVPDITIRNMPWHLALENRPLASLVKTHRANIPEHHPEIGLPLKALIMVSAPEESTRLNYEEEELKILQAFAPLMSRGLAQVHFTDDGSLEDLEAKLTENRYHVLHFSGHGAYKDEQGYLLLENKTGGGRKVSAQEFSESLQRIKQSAGYCPDLIVLSACKSAKGGSPDDLRGVADELLAGGVPAVVAMSASILDSCAIEFAMAFYEGLALGNSLPGSFHEALIRLREYEATSRNLKYLRQEKTPGQWLIPQLLASETITDIYDKTLPAEELTFLDAKYVLGDDNLLHLRGGVERKDYHYVFIGRRKERRFALSHLRDKARPAILIRGQGGVGKTALAEHLVVRILAANPRAKVFIQSEQCPELEHLMNQLRDYLIKEEPELPIASELASLKKLTDKFNFLLLKTKEYCNPFFIFDNLEFFQITVNGSWEWDRKNHQDVFAALEILLNQNPLPVILTGRYPLKEFPSLAICELNTVGFIDFYRKCWQLPLKNLAVRIRIRREGLFQLPLLPNEQEEKTTFEEVCRILHKTFGGNYLALEFFNKLYELKGDAVFGTLEKMKALPLDICDEVLLKMGGELVFWELLALLNTEEKEAFTLLAKFRIPVLPIALGMQRKDFDFVHILDRLAELTLAERNPHPTGYYLYYVNPIVKGLLSESCIPDQVFEIKAAGDYHNFLVSNYGSTNVLNDLSEAFLWYEEARERDELNEIGYRLSSYFYNNHQFRQALSFVLRVEKIMADNTDYRIWNISGLIYKIFGQYDLALNYFIKSLHCSQAIDSLKAKGTLLNNIGQIYQSKGDYKKALTYLEESLIIHQKTGDRRGEATTLNNLGTLALSEGDFDTALRYFEKSLKIHQKMLDREGEGSALNNIGQIYQSKGDYKKALTYLEESLKIHQETGDRRGEATTLNNLGTFALSEGDFDTALRYFEKSLKIHQKILDREGEGSALNNIGSIYQSKGDYKKALTYLEESLKIHQETGDRRGEATTLNNIGLIFQTLGDIDKAMGYLQKSLNIDQEIGAKEDEASILNNLGLLALLKAEYENAKSYFIQSLKISKEIGDPASEATSLNSLGHFYSKVENMHETALDNFQESLRIRRKIGDLPGEANSLNNIGEVYRETKDYDLALRYFEESLKINQGVGIPEGEGAILNNIGQIYEAKGCYPEALNYLQQSREIFLNLNAVNEIAYTSTNIGAILFKQNKYENALEFFWDSKENFQKISSPNIHVPESYLNVITQMLGEKKVEEIFEAYRRKS